MKSGGTRGHHPIFEGAVTETDPIRVAVRVVTGRESSEHRVELDDFAGIVSGLDHLPPGIVVVVGDVPVAAVAHGLNYSTPQAVVCQRRAQYPAKGVPDIPGASPSHPQPTGSFEADSVAARTRLAYNGPLSGKQ